MDLHHIPDQSKDEPSSSYPPAAATSPRIPGGPELLSGLLVPGAEQLGHSETTVGHTFSQGGGRGSGNFLP